MTMWVGGGLAVAGTVYSSNQAGKAADAAASGDQDAIAQQQLAQQRMEDMLKPYRKAGRLGLDGQLNLLGLMGGDAQQAAITDLEKSPYFTSMVKSGENALLQNASATGGLRGGNTAAALAEFRPQMLAQTIENQYGKLGNLALMGQNSAAGTASNIMQSGANISNLMSNMGQTRGQGIVAQGQNVADMFGQIGKMYGEYKAGP